ncbi:DUF6491 family protein [Thermomonas hydrothermalis]|uniref:Lipoprotein n=1 Tax=Thermomonas hydrothermalis TaxID=213588 RepID=A0A1M4UBU9_9GAMM|nr:DUF6491 family protein [Thermomonas hydrothermalis]MCL6618262.1 DUF6491 family protein [Thermomonas hydrothermalis]SHE54020.1 hypothetical protein SAMN02745204_00649 [Thermomonas hydrothermalis]
MPSKKPHWVAALAVTAAVLAGCASGPRMSDADKLALYEQHAGAPVSSFSYTMALDGWTPLGDSALAVWASPGRAYLLKLYGPCNNLSFAPMISLSRSVGQVWAGFDKVIPVGFGPRMPDIPCTIKSIQPLDVKAIRQAERDASKIAQPVERPAEATAPAGS